MKAMISIAALFLSLNASAFSVDLPSLSNSDFEATSVKAREVALKKASNVAANLGLVVESLEEVDGSGLTSKYVATTNSKCEITVAVGLFFKSKVVATQNCQ